MTTVSADTNFVIGAADAHARFPGKGAAPLFAVKDKIESIVETSYTLSENDHGKILVFLAGSAVAVTVPAGLPGGQSTGLLQWGAGAVTPTASGGATITSRSGFTKTAGVGALISLLAIAADRWVLLGDGAA